MFTGSIVSYPERGSFGRSSWRGNTSGRLLRDLFETFKPRVVIDPMCGSDTTGDVIVKLNAEGHRIEYHGRDLHQGYDLLTDSLAAETNRPADLIFLHPPYFNIVKYSGNVWGREAHPSDLSHAETYEQFLCLLQRTLLNAFDALQRGGRLAVLVGDIRKLGIYYPLQSHVASFAPGVVESIIIKAQHNTHSGRQTYNNNLIRIEHESLIILRRDGVVFGALDATLAISERLKMFSRCTWRAIVEYAFEQYGNRASLEQLYEFIERNAHTRIQSEFWREKVRQTVRAVAVRVERGVYARSAQAPAQALA